MNVYCLHGNRINQTIQEMHNFAGAIHPFIVCWGATKLLGGGFVERKISSDNANKLWAMLCKTFLHKQKSIRYGYLGGKFQDNQSRIKLVRAPRKCCQKVISYWY